MMKSIFVITGGALPVPAVRGGAVETLVELLLENNERDPSFEIQVVSCADRKIRQDALSYQHARFYFVRYPPWITARDRLHFYYADAIRRDWRGMFTRTRLRGEYFIKTVCERFPLQDYDAVVVENNMSFLPAVAAALGDQFGSKCYYHMHSALIDNPDMIPFLAGCRKILTVSDFVKLLLQRETPELNSTDIQRVRNGIRSAAAPSSPDRERAALRRELGIGMEETVFLYSGRLSAEKGVMELLRAYGQAADGGTRLVIAGGAVSGGNIKTDYVRRIRREAGKYGDSVLWTGYIESGDMGRYYRMADALVVPSIVDDAAPLTVLEGMSQGLYIIAAKRGGIPEYLRGYGRYTLLDCENTEALSNVLRRFVDREPKTRLPAREQPFFYTDQRFFAEFRAALKE